MFPSALVVAPNLIAATSTKSSSGSPVFLILIVLLFGVYFFWLRPQRARMRQQQSRQQAPDVGDEVITTSGIIGRVVSITDDRAVVEVSPGQLLTFHRSALGRRLDPYVPESADDLHELGALDDHEHDHDAPGGESPGATPSDGGPTGQWWPTKGEDDPGETEGPS